MKKKERYGVLNVPSNHINSFLPTVRDLARECGAELNALELQEWQLMFRLARRLQSIPGTLKVGERDIETFYPAVELFCQLLIEEYECGQHIDLEDTEAQFYNFAYAWDMVKFPEGMGPLETAFARAKFDRITPIPELGADYIFVASLAFHLQKLQGDAPILLPVDRIGKLLQKTKIHASRLVRLLVRYGLLCEVDGQYSYKARKAKRYKFLFESGRYKIGDPSLKVVK